MPPKPGGVSRSVRHGNTANKNRGSVAQFQQKAVASTKVPMKFKKIQAAPEPKPAMDLEDLVVKAKPPKKVKA